mmetsp:Transcript_40096/g.128638  ORF Transcript_40096/g.128638 Transcript_40096/m.128638 type:complete len:224 (-) Transcript_40096:71-742(-)
MRIHSLPASEVCTPPLTATSRPHALVRLLSLVSRAPCRRKEAHTRPGRGRRSLPARRMRPHPHRREKAAARAESRMGSLCFCCRLGPSVRRRTGKERMATPSRATSWRRLHHYLRQRALWSRSGTSRSEAPEPAAGAPGSRSGWIRTVSISRILAACSWPRASMSPSARSAMQLQRERPARNRRAAKRGSSPNRGGESCPATTATAVASDATEVRVELCHAPA